jgi:hypothetical protein
VAVSFIGEGNQSSYPRVYKSHKLKFREMLLTTNQSGLGLSVFVAVPLIDLTEMLQ